MFGDFPSFVDFSNFVYRKTSEIEFFFSSISAKEMKLKDVTETRHLEPASFYELASKMFSNTVIGLL